MTESPLLQAERIEVRKLFGLYDHAIDLNLRDRVTILHGPNGVGKSMLLSMVKALFSARFGVFSAVPFESLQVAFDDGTSLAIRGKSSQDRPGDSLRLVLSRPGQPELDHRVSDVLAKSAASQLERAVPWISRLDEDAWFDDRTEEVITLEQVHARYAANLPPEQRKSLLDEPDWLRELRQRVQVHLIEAQRLVIVEPRPSYRARFGRPHPPHRATVKEYSADLADRIKGTMARYGSTSQALDQTFPQRLLERTDEGPAGSPELKAFLQRIEERRKGLKDIGLLDETANRPFDPNKLDQMDPSQMRVMDLYARDAEKKLQVMERLAEQTRLLLDNVNSKFRHKRIRIDREHGFLAEDDMGRTLDLDALSSGEQHELVMHYDLLFRVRPNTLVLIDEPELSLHVAWQKAFLGDLLKTVEVANFDAVLATHSPYIVGDRDDLMVALDDSRE